VGRRFHRAAEIALGSPTVAEIERVMLGEEIVAVVVRGELDLADESRAELAIDFVVGLEYPGVLLDLAGCEFIDASGLRMLLRANQRMVRAGATVAVARPGASVRRIFEITGLAEQFALYADRDAAFEALELALARPVKTGY
jgi:anti-sigma B factor antagonist